MNPFRRERDPHKMPVGLVLEPPAKSLAALVTNEAFARLEATVLSQWLRIDEFADLQRYGIGPINRALFHGPPGNGKTVCSQLIASRLNCPLYRVTCETLRTCYLGETTANVGAIMDWLERQPTCVILWDEVETIFPARSSGGPESGGQQEVASSMTVFWQRLDRWSGPQLFLLATNMPEKMDQALLSRIESQVYFGPPTAEQARKVVAYWVETLHEFGAEKWSVELFRRVASANTKSFPKSFRELWQWIAQAARDYVISKPEGA